MRIDRGRGGEALTDLIETGEQIRFAAGINLKTVNFAVGPSYCLGVEIDCKNVIPAAGLRSQIFDNIDGKAYGQDAILEAIIVENVGKARRDDAADALIEQGPRCVFARRAAAKILAREQD